MCAQRQNIVKPSNIKDFWGKKSKINQRTWPFYNSL